MSHASPLGRDSAMNGVPGLLLGEKRTRYAIVQGGMGYGISLGRLAGAVAREGGLGTIAGVGLTVEELSQEIDRAREIAEGGLIGVNLMYALYPNDRWSLLNMAIEKRVDMVVIGAGFGPDPFRKYLKPAGIPGFAIVSREKAARIVSRVPGIAGIVVESGEAGGHLGPEMEKVDESIWDLFPRVRRALDKANFRGPVVAAGNMCTGQDAYRALVEMGADGVQIGTLFAMTIESNASDYMKQALVNAKGTVVQHGSPTGYPTRCIETQKEQMPRIHSMEQCKDCLAYCVHRDTDFKESGCINVALRNIQLGREKDNVIFAGKSVERINDVVSVAERFRRLRQEFEAAAKSRGMTTAQVASPGRL